MQMKMFAFECGLLMGMAAVCLLPPVRNEMKTMFQKAKNSMQSTKKVLLAKGKKLKEDTLDAASDILQHAHKEEAHSFDLLYLEQP